MAHIISLTFLFAICSFVQLSHALVQTEADFFAALTGPGPVLIGADINLTKPLPTIFKFITVQGSGPNCTNKEGGQCTLLANYKFRHFVVSSGGHLILSDLHLKGGQSANAGGSILVAFGGRLTVDRVFFQYNVAAGLLYGGGAIEAESKSVILVRNSRFFRNTAYFGGAIDISGGAVATVQNCLFHNNSANIAGGAVSFITAGGCTMDSNVFSANKAPAAATVLADHTNLTVCGATSYHNTASISGTTVLSRANASIALCGVQLSSVYQDTSTGGHAREDCSSC